MPTADLDELPAASSFLSSRWSQDNLVTMRPGRLYDGPVLERIEQDTLEYLVQELAGRVGPLEVGAGRMGVHTWDIGCSGPDGCFVLQVPRALDEPGSRGRALRDVPRQNVANLRHFRERGLRRFAVEPRESLLLGHGVPVALFEALPEHHAVGFGRGAIQLEVSEGKQAWLVGLGPVGTAEVLAELVAALVYHYEPDVDGGSAVADVSVNDGDFALRRRADGTFDLRLTAIRRLETGVEPNILLLYLTQLLAYEDWTVDSKLTGLPTLMSNPSVAFEGVARGLRYRALDQGQDEAGATSQAFDWISDFGKSREGRAYRPWVERFVAGQLPLAFGADLREHWWRVIPLAIKQGLLELKGRTVQGQADAGSARAIRTFLDTLAREIGRTVEDEPGTFRVNDLGREGVERLLGEAQVPSESRAGIVERLFAHWPHRNLDQLVGRVPEARGLRRLKSRLTFGTVVPEADMGTLRAVAGGRGTAQPRQVANREVFGHLTLPAALHDEAIATFPTFEAYMDAALHDPKWGYYSRSVVIGRSGHFATHPEQFSPHYGRWLATWAFKAWQDLLAHGELAETDPFPIVEFGAGNGRLARDILDAIAARGAYDRHADGKLWATFSERARYHVYEVSESLRQKQRELLGARAAVAAGDARCPRETLQRDFPAGLRGFVVTNEVPDAFGVHKLVLGADGTAWATLVVPRVERSLLEALPAELARRIGEVSTSIRRTFGYEAYPDDFYLDERTWLATMNGISDQSGARYDDLLASLWFEEVYVPVTAVPSLARELATNATDHALALAAAESGVVLYPNVHAARFMREIATSLAAGFVVTIDYGDTTFGLVQGARHGDFPFRVYRDSPDFRPRPNDPYTAPGTQDLTTDVSFTALARAGCDAGLHLVHYGPERDVSGDELPELLRAAAEQPLFGELLGNPVFQVLVLGTRPSDAFRGPLSTPRSPFAREQDVPKARRGKVADIERALARLRPV